MRIGILGGGQLGRMLAAAAHRLELEPLVLDPKPGCPAAAVAPSVCADWSEPSALRALADCDVVTWEFENVPSSLVESLAQTVCVRPAPRALRETSDRLREKRLLRGLGIPTADFCPVDSRSELDRAVAALGLPAVLKTRRFGYDGRGQRVLRRSEDLDGAWSELGGRPLLLEALVRFEREVSLIAVRSADGETALWDPTENTHVAGILRVSRAPARGCGGAGLARARRQVQALLDSLDYVGVAAVEFFVRGDDWIANEVACRVHNSGHWTEDGAATSQFENHVRAVAGLPLGSTRTREPSVMVNLIGRRPDRAGLLGMPEARVHLYGKSPAPDRKLGHVNLVAPTTVETERLLAELVDRVGDPALKEAREVG
jgi:5-(carboxyamino)imidazole ribonucleotide synthase